jgi:3-hydroxymyristoyl/3-hydroxydecanoyl-(acyl carrier protein) dehydratase
MSKQGALVPAASFEAGHWPEHVRWEITGSRVSMYGRVPRDLFHLIGHFPENPLVPGFVVVSWALGALERSLQRPINVRAMRRLKFLRALRPGDAFLLSMELGACSSGRRQAAFSFLEDGEAPGSFQEVPFCSGVLDYDEGSYGVN